MPNIENSRSAKLDAIFGTPLFAVLLAIGCNVLWGSAFPFIKMGYRLFAIETSDTASILCFAGVRFMLGSLLVLAGSLILEGKLPQPPCGKVLGECCALGLWQTTAQYAFYYMAVALLTGAFGGILNSTQSFLGVIFAHFLYGDADRMTPAKTLGCVLGFAGVLIGTIGNHGGGSAWGVFCMLLATVIFTLSGPWNKSVTKKADSFAVCFLNLFVGGLALLLIGLALGGSLHPQSALGLPVLLYLAFRRFAESLLILGSLPFALTGGIWLLYLLGDRLSVAVGTGFIALAGLAAEFGGVMIVYLRHAVQNDKSLADPKTFTVEALDRAIEHGAALRVRPKTMTVAVVLAGLIPILVGTGAGSEVMSRIAAPMVGGMVTAPLLSLFVIPAAWKLIMLRRRKL